eukprot:62992-Pelagomonas_calceolata.AAC.1
MGTTGVVRIAPQQALLPPPTWSTPLHSSSSASCSSGLAPKQPAPCSISRPSSRKQGPSSLPWKQQQQWQLQ